MNFQRGFYADKCFSNYLFLIFSNVSLLFQTLLPRGHVPNKLRTKMQSINELISQRCAGQQRIQIVPIEKGLIQQDGTISHLDLFDYLNLTNNGAKKCFEPIHDLISQVCSKRTPLF